MEVEEVENIEDTFANVVPELDIPEVDEDELEKPAQFNPIYGSIKDNDSSQLDEPEDYDDDTVYLLEAKPE